MIEVSGLKELMQDLENASKKALPKAAKNGALDIAKKIAAEYKATIPKDTGLLAQSVRGVSSKTLQNGVYRAAAVVFRMKKVSKKRYEKLTSKNKWGKEVKNTTKNRIDYYASAYYAHYIEYGFWHKGGRKKSAKGKTNFSGKTTFVKGTKTMQKAREKINLTADILVETRLNTELSKLGF